MPTPSGITYTRTHAEVVEFVDQSRQVKMGGGRCEETIYIAGR